MQNIAAVLVKLSLSTPGNSATDEELTEETKQRHSMSGDVGKWKANKLDPEDVKPITQAIGIVRTKHYKLTLPWERGFRLLPAHSQSKYAEEVETAGQQCFFRMRDEFISGYPAAVERMRIQLNGRFNADDYPDPVIMRAAFRFKVSYQPMPESSHFITSIASGELDRMRQSLEEANQERINQAIADVWERLLTPLRTMAARLTEPKPMFRATLVSNVFEIVDLIPALNLDRDPAIEAAAREIRERLGTITADALKDSPVLRTETAATALALAEQFGRIGKRKLAA
jgi:hypothetical protein